MSCLKPAKFWTYHCRLLQGYVDDEDLKTKLVALFEVSTPNILGMLSNIVPLSLLFS